MACDVLPVAMFSLANFFIGFLYTDQLVGSLPGEVGQLFRIPACVEQRVAASSKSTSKQALMDSVWSSLVVLLDWSAFYI